MWSLNLEAICNNELSSSFCSSVLIKWVLMNRSSMQDSNIMLLTHIFLECLLLGGQMYKSTKSQWHNDHQPAYLKLARIHGFSLLANLEPPYEECGKATRGYSLTALGLRKSTGQHWVCNNSWCLTGFFCSL